MAETDLIDYSPHDPKPLPALESASRLVLIDNYDSFTWNVYQYLVLEGANVSVYRNDKITLDELIAKNPTQLVISPGPGHPDTDSGISGEAIKYFCGKIPVLGVCMGQQCIFSAFGGKVDVTGEILHGKTSPLKHDGKGLYKGLAQDLPVTRYHSLAGTYSTLPECLQVSSWVEKGPTVKTGVIMGVRHKKYVVEGVQFHPESILTQNGRIMLRNFLRMRGGTWEENQRFLEQDAVKGSQVKQDKENILEKIYARRRTAVAAQMKTPSLRFDDLQAAYNLNLAPPQISFPERLRRSPYPISLMAEVKRASPSKGPIAMTACAPAQARKYALAGASVISVLTEPEWFKGSIEDLRQVRAILDGMPGRPAILRKEFVFDEYQILEARLAGADTILLIVKMLDKETLERLYKYSRSLGMEPLVEVNTADEMDVAIKLGAQVIGVNNRDLTSFEVDLATTSRLMDKVPKDTLICALSGIFGPKDVEAYKQEGVGAVLVGEALMRASDTTAFISKLLGGADASRDDGSRPLLVKVCGSRDAETVKHAIHAGADMIGIILVPGRRRTVSDDEAIAISRVVHGTAKPHEQYKVGTRQQHHAARDYFEHMSEAFVRHDRALLVGVFQNQPLECVLAKQKLLDLDVVQLHGDEPIEWANLIPVPVIRSFAPGETGLGRRCYHALPLLDSGIGGTGKRLDVSSVKTTLESDDGLKIVLAGGLNPDNVKDAINNLGTFGSRVVAVDVSSGVEDADGKQDVLKIELFIKAAKSCR